MAEKVRIQTQVLDSDGADVTGTMPFFQDIPVAKTVVRRVQDYPTDTGPIPNLLLVVTLGNKNPLEAIPRGAEAQSLPVRKQTPAQKKAAQKHQTKADQARTRRSAAARKTASKGDPK